MNRLGKYQDGLLKFIKIKNIINDMSYNTRNILNNLLVVSDHIPAILCLTILNKQCQKNNIKIHGYYLAAGIELMLLLAMVSCNREHYETIYDSKILDNMYMEVVNTFYKCILQNIDTLTMSNTGSNNALLTKICIVYASKYIPLITEKCTYMSKISMKKTDLFCSNISKADYLNYKKKYMLDKNILHTNILNRYGSVCKLALIFGWMFGQNEYTDCNETIIKLEKHSNNIGKLLKLYDDFKNFNYDIKTGVHSLNYIINYGIKDTYNELTESKILYTEGLIMLDLETKTCKEIIDTIVNNVDNIIKDISVDMNTQYENVSAY